MKTNFLPDWKSQIVFKVSRLDFSGQYLPSLSINHVAIDSWYGKMTTTALSKKGENLSWVVLCWHRSRRNDVVIHSICSRISRPDFFSTIAHGSLFLQYLPQYSWSLSKTYEKVIEIFWDEVFMVGNAVKSGQIFPCHSFITDSLHCITSK